MAWSWRKRKTLFPGVRLNFGRKGISTTIGPRGASMTFGPNGTYLNTSIPGLGLYNRRRIGGKNNTTMTNDNSGCKGTFLSFLSVVLWFFVISTALIGFAINTWVGCAFIGVVILSHIIVAIIAKHRENAASGSVRKDPSNSLREALYQDEIMKAKNTPHDITKDYYKQVTKVAEELYADYERVLKTPNLDSLIESLGITFKMNGRITTSTSDKIRLLFWVDVTRCYTGLGHLIDLDSKEGFGLLYFIALTQGCTQGKPFSELAFIKGAYQKDAESILKSVKAFIDTAPTYSEIFLLSRLLATNDTKLHRKFLVDIYRFASITAKADNAVTAEEAEWLSNIMKLQGNGNQEIVPEMDDEPIMSPVVRPVISSRLDPMFADVARWVVAKQEGSTSRIQRQFEIGYNRAGNLSDQLQEAGIVGPNKGPKGRDVLIQDPQKLEELLLLVLQDDYSNPTGSGFSTDAKPISKPKSQNSSKMLDSLIGLESVKKEVETLTNFIKIQQTREAKGLKTSAVSYHCVFTGNPGTGKTTVARILAKIYKNLGVVSKGHLVETDRAGLVAEYVGQTAVKTNKIIDSALDGVLFIDEAYSLISKSENDYGKEAIATLLKRMEDNRDRLIVILAGYTKEMKDFIDSNPGLQSRFNRYIEFPDYSAEELLQIFEVSMKKYDYHFGEGTKEALQQYFENEIAHKDANFGNGRLVRNVFEKTLERQANRLAQEVNLTTGKLSQIEPEDLPIK
ncbi:MAG: DUF4236 domain-containing protein [Paludibacteraceae bacterium]|nr:DUF4236 domain-containing protein [Paludibacteraceae bacterium]